MQILLGGFGDEIKHQDLFHQTLKTCAELLVLGMREVGFEVGLGFEGDEETVCKAIRFAFWADVGAPFHFLNERDAGFESDEGFFHFLNLSGRCIALEFEHHDVPIGRFGGDRATYGEDKETEGG